MSDVVIDLVAKNERFAPVLNDSEQMVQDFAYDIVNALENLDISGGMESELKSLSESIRELSQQAQRADVDDLADDMEEVKDDTEKADNALAGFGRTFAAFLAAAAAMVAFDAIKDSLWGFIEGAGEAELATTRLESVIDATGQKAGWSSEQLTAIADSLEQVTRFEAETTQEAAALLTKFDNIRGDIFKDAIFGAADMAEALGMDLPAATNMLGRALNDPIEGLNALRKSGVDFTNAQKEQIESMIKAGDVMGAQRMILTSLDEKFGGTAERMGGTFLGKMQIAQNLMGAVTDVIGEALMPAFDGLIPLVEMGGTVMGNLKPVIEGVVQEVIQFGKMSMEWMRPAFDVMVEGAVASWTAAEIWSERWDDILTLIGIKVEYESVKMYNVILYYFTEVMPAAIKWFGENWMNILNDLNNFQTTVLSNMGKNVLEFISGVKDYLTGKSHEFKFTSLLEGFELTTQEFPEVAARVEGALEKELKGRLGSLGLDLAADFGNRMNENMKFLDSLFEKKEEEAADLTAGQFSTDFSIDTKPEKEEKEKKDKEEKEKKEEEDKGSQASFESIESLQQRIQAAAASSTPEDKAKEAAEKFWEGVTEFSEDVKPITDAVIDFKDYLVDMFSKEETKNADKDLAETEEEIAARQAERDQTAQGLLKEISGNIGEFLARAPGQVLATYQ